MCALHLAHLTSVRTRSGFLRSNNRLVPDFLRNFLLFVRSFVSVSFVSFSILCLEFFSAFTIMEERVWDMWIGVSKMREMNEWEENRFTFCASLYG